MLNFQYCSPTKLIFGKGEEANVGTYLKDYGATKVMILTYGTGLPHETKLIETVKKSLEEAGLEYVVFDRIKPNPSLIRSIECAEEVKRQGIDFMLPVGGGSVIDTAKYAAVQALYEGDFWRDCFERKDLPLPTKSIPVGSILTICGAGAEGSEAALIHDDRESGNKLGVDADVLRPQFAILDPELTYTLPPYQTACGIADMFCHVEESYFTHIDDGMFMTEYIEVMMRTIIKYAEIVMKDPTNYLARAQLMLMGTVGNLHFTWCGRIDDGAIHFIQEPIAAKYDSAHGHCIAAITIGWLRYCNQVEPQRFVRYFNRVWNVPVDELHPDEVIAAGIEKQRAFYHMLGLDTCLEAVGYKKEDAEWLAEHADKKRTTGTTGNYVVFTKEMIRELFDMCDHRE